VTAAASSTGRAARPFPLSLRLADFDPGYLAAALLTLVGILPTFGDGVVKSADAPLHVHRIFAMTTLLRTGNLWPRWVPWFHLGYGYPVFNFYPPGVFYIGGVMGLLGIPPTSAFLLIAAFAWVLGSVGMYALAKRFLPPTGALLAAMLWAYAPSRPYEFWHQGSLPQMLSAAFVPWVFWGMVVATRRPSRRALLAVALPFAGMVLTHQPITLVTGLFVAPGVFLVPLVAAWKDWRSFWRRFACVVGGFALGAGLTAIFLLPLAFELKYVQSATEAQDVIPYLISNFLRPAEVFSQPLPMDLTDLRFEMPTTLGLVGGILSALGLLALLRRRRWKLAMLLAGALAFSIFMLLEISLPVWKIIPYLAQLRFPARLLRVGAVFVALAGGASLLWLPKRWQNAGLLVGLTAALVAALPLIYPNQKFVNWPNLSALDEINMEETEHNWGTTSYDEFNPIWGQNPAWDHAVEPEEYVSDPMRIVVNRLDMIRQWPDLKVEQIGTATVRVTVTSARPVRLRQFYFPGWTATLDGKPVDIYPDDDRGEIAVNVPEGEHLISVTYAGTPIQAVGALVTLASIAICVVLAIKRKRDAPPPEAMNDNLAPRLGYGIMAGMTIFALVNTLVITPDTLWFRFRSPPDTPAYMRSPVHQSFGDTFELLGYTLDQTSVAPDGLLNVMLFWRAQKPLDKEYRPVVQLVNMTTSAAWAVSEPFFPGGGKTSLGYPLDRFASEIHTLRPFPDTPPYVGRISVQIVDAGSKEPLRLPDGSDRLLLPPLIRINGNGPTLPRALDDRFGDVVELWCANVKPDGDHLNITLGWHANGTPKTDYTAFIHGLDASGNIVKQADAPPLSGNYPTSLWGQGQNLLDTHTLPNDPAIKSIAIGLYTPDGRLPVSQNGQPVADNRLVVPVEESSCGR
jgi:hypothetical protein